jgi:hypothetical protein
MEGPPSRRGLRNRHHTKPFRAHDDDDDDDGDGTNVHIFLCPLLVVGQLRLKEE